MKKHLNNQSGLTLIELIFAMTITLILLSSLTSILSVSLTTWRMENSRMALQQKGRMAVDRVLREVGSGQKIKFLSSHSVEITKKDGEINIFQLGGGLHRNTLYMIIDKNASGGGIASCPLTENIVTELTFAPFSQEKGQAVLITLVVKDQSTGVEQRFHTASYPWNQL